MTSPYLIAHVVRGLPAFDIAEQVVCPECLGLECEECGNGFWWIISTSGHRAYPYWCCAVEELDFLNGKHPDEYLGVAPSDWPDHYQTLAAPRTDLISALGLNQRTQQSAINRRKV